MTERKNQKEIKRLIDQWLSNSKNRSWFFVLLFALIGSIVILAAHAASTNGSIEPESGSVASPAIVGSSSSASGGSYVQFKAASIGQSQFGIATGAAGWPNQTEWDDTSANGFRAGIDNMANAGAKWIRMTFPWSAFESKAPVNGVHTFKFTMADNVAGYLKSKNINLIVTLGQPPSWNKPNGVYGCTGGTPYVFNFDDYANYANHLATDLKSFSNVKAFEVGNSPNQKQPGEWPTPDACQYTQLIKRVYAQTKAANSGLAVLTGGAGGSVNNTIIADPSDFINSMYADNGGTSNNLFDGVAYHAYSYPNSPQQDLLGLSTDHKSCSNPSKTQAPGPAKSWCRMMVARQVMVDHGDSAKQIWITEYGTPAIPANKCGNATPPHTCWNDDTTISQTRWTAILTRMMPINMNGNGPVIPIPTDCGTTANPTADTFPHCSPVNGFLGAGSANTQATMLSQAYTLASTYSWVKVLCWFTFFDQNSPQASDNGSGDPNGGDFEGLVDFNGHIKPAYTTYQHLSATIP